MDSKEIMHKQQKILGILCILLPVLCIGFGIIGKIFGTNYPTWFYSISDTYYSNSKIFMIGILGACGIYFWAYKGYDLWDNIITSITAVCSFGIITFPCWTAYADKVGIFCLPVNISGHIHNAFAITLYLSFFAQVLRFRKSSGEMTEKKKLRNRLYLICFLIMAFGVIFYCSKKFIPFFKTKGWLILITEFFVQFGYGFAWLIKSEAFKKLNDD